MRRPLLSNPGFTLVELLVATALLVGLMVLLLQVTDQTNRIWRSTSGKVQQFREAREGFETLTRKLSQATLNPYYEYFDASGNPRNATNSASFTPVRYGRNSELRYLSGPAAALGVSSPLAGTPVTHSVFFQAPTGDVNDTSLRPLRNLLTTQGFHVELVSDAATKPPFVAATRSRFRLMHLVEPSENLVLYTRTSGNAGLLTSGPGGRDWFQVPLASSANVHLLADNIVALVVLPRLSRNDEAAPHST